jgi:predicted dehydrogenase
MIPSRARKEAGPHHMKLTKIRWGVLGVARIATEKVIPAMQRGRLSQVTAIGSRDLQRARAAAPGLGIAKAYGSYQELLQDPEIDAIYNPLPNHLHVPLSIAALEAGKHVLCEKPLSLSVEGRRLLDARNRTAKKAGEAFMVRTHPQWVRTRDLVRSGAIGRLRSIFGYFSYFLDDPANIRNVLEYGGGGIMDIGCYPINTSRFIFGEEPERVSAQVEYDPDMKTDRLASAILDFPSGQSVFTCGTQVAPYQRMHFIGTDGRIEIEIPFNAPPDRPCRIFVNDAVEEFPICDQYTIQGDEFSRAIIEDAEVPVPIEDALKNMAVIEAVFAAGKSGRWENIAAA